VFHPLVEVVADALLPALPDLDFVQLCALGQQTWRLMADGTAAAAAAG